MDEQANGKPAGVMGTLPATRPERLGRPRDERGSAAPRPPKATAAAKPAAAAKATAARPAAAKPARKPAARKPAPRKPAAHKPAAVTPGSPPLERTPRMTEMPPARPIGPPRGTELVTTAIHAAGELTQIGLTLGGKALKRAVDRIPRP